MSIQEQIRKAINEAEGVALKEGPNIAIRIFLTGDDHREFVKGLSRYDSAEFVAEKAWLGNPVTRSKSRSLVRVMYGRNSTEIFERLIGESAEL